MHALLTLFRRLGHTACPLQAVAGGRAEHRETRPYWLLAQAGMPRI